ncbi:MAG TPA: Snf7 family protein [Candidatus Bathyarchaeia archaeon]|nr:Snf7 family protein [Candidatus Bathyarchaeia archaeon]
MTSRVKEMVNQDRTPLKSKIESAVRSLQIQTQKLDKISYSLLERDKTLFQKIINAQATHDTIHANIYANELAELRKTEKTVSQSHLALEQVTLRIQTVREWGDLVASMAPVIGVISNVKKAVIRVMPEAERELEYVGQSISGLLMEAGEYTGGSLNLTSSSEEADVIMSEAAAFAEQKMREKFPEMPSATASGEKT